MLHVTYVVSTRAHKSALWVGLIPELQSTFQQPLSSIKELLIRLQHFTQSRTNNVLLVCCSRATLGSQHTALQSDQWHPIQSLSILLLGRLFTSSESPPHDANRLQVNLIKTSHLLTQHSSIKHCCKLCFDFDLCDNPRQGMCCSPNST